jgi:AcrR family transcriptional regulator
VPRVKSHTEELAARLLDVTARLLAAHGPGGVTTRAVAAAAGTSTTAVYSLYGGKSGLFQAVYVAGYGRLAESLQQVDASDRPAADLIALAHAYRASALEDPHLYELLFGRRVLGFVLDEDALAAARQAQQPLRQAVRRCQEARALTGDENDLVIGLWAALHGLVSLELHGWLGDAPQTRDRRFSSSLLVLFPQLRQHHEDAIEQQ